MTFGVGIGLIALGLIPFVSGYQRARSHDSTHWLSYAGSVILGVVVIVWGLLRFFG